MRYHVVFQPDDNGTILVTCPDLPELVTFGLDEDDARRRAADAIATVLQGRITARQEIPHPADHAGALIDLGALVDAKVALYRAMRADGVTRAELARRMRAHGPTVDRLLDLRHDSRIQSIEDAVTALGRTMRIAVSKAA